MKNKKAFEMNFAWIFSIIVGAAILFLAIYAASQVIKTERYKIDTQTATKLSILLDPLETSLESGISEVVRFSSETRIYNDKCYTYGNFGEQSIGVSVSSGVGEKWQKPAYGEPQHNKYIFSNSIEQGEEFVVFSKALKLPFKVSDLIFFSGKEYCFVQSPGEIKSELQGLGLTNINFTETKSNCPENSEKVCFTGSGCDISVYSDYEFETGHVDKGGKSLYYTGPLIYGTFFSSPEVYECNVKRLLNRLINLCFIYKDKIEILERKDCSSLLDSHLNEMINLARNGTSQDLLLIQEKAQEIERIDNTAECRIF